jgi:glutamyl-tRNA synthetase
VSQDDLEELQPGAKVRLKDLCNVELTSLDLTGKSLSKHIGNDLGILKEGARIIHWVPVNDNVPTEIHKLNGQIVKGFSESAVKDSLDKNIQFERFGFVRLGTKTEPLEAWFTHK